MIKTYFRKSALLIIITVYSISSLQAQYTLKETFIDQNLNDAIAQLAYLAPNVPSEQLPRTYEAGKPISSPTSWWTSGFYPGTLLYLYEYSGDQKLLDKAKEKLALLEKEKNNTSTHDLGFMLYCSFGNALRITGDSSAYIEILLTGANSLSSRFNQVTKNIHTWKGLTLL